MRLSQDQINGIVKAIDHFVHLSRTQLYLFGSRTKDHLKGGDIDLLLLTELESLILEKHHILAGIKKEIGDQKIDLKIITFNNAKNDIFVTMIMPDTLLLHQWTL